MLVLIATGVVSDPLWSKIIFSSLQARVYMIVACNFNEMRMLYSDADGHQVAASPEYEIFSDNDKSTPASPEVNPTQDDMAPENSTINAPSNDFRGVISDIVVDVQRSVERPETESIIEQTTSPRIEETIKSKNSDIVKAIKTELQGG